MASFFAGMLIALVAFIAGGMFIISGFESQAEAGLITVGGKAYVTVEIGGAP